MTRILVVDDDPLIRALISAHLAQSGHDVTLVGDGFQALEHLRVPANIPDVMITDKNMPGMSGLVLSRRVREIYPQLRIIFMTAGHLEIEDVHEMALAGANYILPKPFSSGEQVRTAISEVLKTLSPQEETPS